MSVLPVCMSVHYMQSWCPQRSEEGIGPPELEVWIAMNHHVVLGTEPQSIARATSESSTWPQEKILKSLTSSHCFFYYDYLSDYLSTRK